MPLIVVFFSVLLTNFSALADDKYYNVPEMASLSGVGEAKSKSVTHYAKYVLRLFSVGTSQYENEKIKKGQTLMFNNPVSGILSMSHFPKDKASTGKEESLITFQGIHVKKGPFSKKYKESLYLNSLTFQDQGTLLNSVAFLKLKLKQGKLVGHFGQFDAWPEKANVSETPIVYKKRKK